MYKEDIIDGEVEALKDYLFGYCDNPLESAGDYIKELFKIYGIDDSFRIRWILEECYIDSYVCSTPPKPSNNCIWLNVAEIEVPAYEVEEEEKDDFTINGDYAYLYIGYGIMFYFDHIAMEEAIKRWKDEE